MNDENEGKPKRALPRCTAKVEGGARCVRWVAPYAGELCGLHYHMARRAAEAASNKTE